MISHYIDLSWRSAKRTPVVTLLMVLAIALGIGITMTSLSIHHMMSMDPIPSKSNRIFYPQLNTLDDGNDWRTEDNLPYQLTYIDAVNLYNAPIPKYKTPSFKTGFSVHKNSPEFKPTMQQARLVNREFFSLFERPFVYGEPWSKNAQENNAYVTVISESLNEKLFGGANSVGQQVYLDNNIYRIVGIVEDWQHVVKYYDVNNGSFEDAETVFIPFALGAIEQLNTWGNNNGWKYEPGRSYEDLLVSERLWTQFWVQLDNEQEKQDYEEFLMAYMQEQQKLGRFNRENLEFGLRNVTQWLEYNKVVSEENSIMLALSFMFLAVCLANILGLLLAKFLRRAPEVGVRRALGASKRQVFLQHVVEVALLGLAGGLLGILVAQLGLWGVRSTVNDNSGLAEMDIYMYLAAPTIAIGTSFIAGLYPAWLVCKTPPAIYLKSQ